MTISNNGRRRGGRGGFTLAEAIMATVVVGIAAAGVLLPFGKGATVRAEGMRRTLAAKLAADLMEEIVDKPFHDPDGSSYYYNLGPDSGETSVTYFDNVDDYHGYTEGQGQIRDVAKNLIADWKYAKFSRDVTCAYVYVPQESGVENARFIRVTVQVYYGGNQVTNVTRLIGK
jgi:hypothetical protein